MVNNQKVIDSYVFTKCIDYMYSQLCIDSYVKFNLKYIFKFFKISNQRTNYPFCIDKYVLTKCSESVWGFLG